GGDSRSRSDLGRGAGARRGHERGLSDREIARPFDPSGHGARARRLAVVPERATFLDDESDEDAEGPRTPRTRRAADADRPDGQGGACPGRAPRGRPPLERAQCVAVTWNSRSAEYKRRPSCSSRKLCEKMFSPTPYWEGSKPQR